MLFFKIIYISISLHIIFSNENMRTSAYSRCYMLLKYFIELIVVVVVVVVVVCDAALVDTPHVHRRMGDDAWSLYVPSLSMLTVVLAHAAYCTHVSPKKRTFFMYFLWWWWISKQIEECSSPILESLIFKQIFAQAVCCTHATILSLFHVLHDDNEFLKKIIEKYSSLTWERVILKQIFWSVIIFQKKNKWTVISNKVSTPCPTKPLTTTSSEKYWRPASRNSNEAPIVLTDPNPMISAWNKE